MFPPPACTSTRSRTVAFPTDLVAEKHNRWRIVYDVIQIFNTTQFEMILLLCSALLIVNDIPDSYGCIMVFNDGLCCKSVSW